MPRNPSGTYTLPSGNPVEAGTLIEANWANTTLNDIANELTDSLSRSGEGGMLAPFRLADGLQATPGIAWLNEPSTGFYRAGSGEMWGVVSGTQVLQYTANGVLIPASRTFTNNGNTTLGGTLAVTGASTLTGALTANGGVGTTTLSTSGLATLNSASVTGNLSVGGTLTLTGGLTLNGNVTVGDSSADTLTINSTITSNMLFTDNTYDIGASGATRPRHVYVAGNGVFGGTLGVTGVATLTANPVLSAGTANGVLYLNGSKVATSGSVLSFDGTNVSLGASVTSTTWNRFLGIQANYPGIVFDSTASGGEKWSIGADASVLTFRNETDTATRMVIDGSGNVGIGTSAPTGKLHVSGNFIRVEQSGANDLYMGRASDLISGGPTGAAIRYDGTALRIGASSTEVAIFSGGDLGIGTSSPASKLHVSNTAAATRITITDDVASGRSGYIESNYSDALVIGTTSGVRGIRFSPDNQPRMFLSVAGNLGIGTSSPAYKLDVAGNIRVLNSGADSQVIVVAPSDSYSPLIRWGVSGVRDSGLLGFPAGEDSLVYRSGANSFSTGTEQFRITAAGNVGIGTSSPSRKLQVSTAGNNYIASVNTSGSTSALLLGAESGKTTLYSWTTPSGATGVPMTFYTGASEVMRLDTSGNLGLGVTPSAWWSAIKPLQMSGNGFVGSASNYTYLGANFFYNSSANPVYVASAAASLFEQGAGAFRWYQAASGTAGNTISFTQAMTLDASGRLGTGGVTSPGYALDVGNSASGNMLRMTASTTQMGGFISAGTPFFGAISNHDFVLMTNSTERARITSGGNLLLGTTTAAYSGTLLNIGSTSDSQNGVQIQTSTTGVGYLLFGDGSGADAYRGEINYAHSSDAMAFKTAATERARITSGGDLLVGTTGSVVSAISRFRVAATNAPAVDATTTAAADAVVDEWNSATSGDNTFERFWTEAGSPTLRGLIDYNRAGGLVRYNTTSDYRAKDVYGLLENTGSAIDALKVYTGKMKGATQERPMLIAHEAQEVAPYAVSGVKDEENEDGTPKYQQMDHSSLVPLLIAEIQSLRARVAALEGAN
jgi:hypothetical protein